MTLRDEIGSQEFLYLTSISEPQDNLLRLVIEAAHAKGPAEPLDPSLPALGEGRTIVADETTPAWEVTFDTYVAYAVLNESFALPAQDDEAWEGAQFFHRYRKSRFLEHIRSVTFASDEWPGPMLHFEIVCLNHVVEIVTTHEPEITRQR